ncbi:hypothetical protein [Leuconostoc pseudomesenteroides]|uniref:hypothetical protein n=1 Tax=Leuconostoc pseudomesenteroides TaxID=33968 RepID=UPI0039EA0DEF
MVKSAIQVQREAAVSLNKRLKILQNKYTDVLPEEIPQVVKNEILYINDLLASLTFGSADFSQKTKMVNIRNSCDEEWYMQQMQKWLDKHPNAITGQKGRSTIYKFALHFFVENIALQSENSLLNANELADRVKNMRYRNGQLANIERKLKDIDDQLTFNTAMTHFYGRRVSPDYEDEPLIPAMAEEQGELMTNIFSQPSIHNNGVAELYTAFKKMVGREKALLKKQNRS